MTTHDSASPILLRSRNILGRRLATSFVAVVVLGVAGAAIGVVALLRVDAATEAATVHHLASERLAAEALRLRAINAERYKAMALSSEPEVGEILSADIRATEDRYAGVRGELGRRLTDMESRALLNRLDQAGDRFQAAVRALVAARDSNFTERIQREYRENFLPGSTALMNEIQTLARAQRDNIDRESADIARQGRIARWSLVAFSAAATCLGLLLAAWLARSISRPLQRAGRTAERVSALDLREDIEGHDRDEAGRLLMGLAGMQQALRSLVARVRDATMTLQLASGEIATANQDLSARTDATALRLEQTAAALDQLMHQLQETVHAAGRAESQAGDAARVAREGGEVVATAVTRMQEARCASERVADILGVIDGIAFQTNILALNAAVEAARAGEAGRGFAVVAAEVRRLSNRCGEAAGEVRLLVQEATRSVEAGAALVTRAGECMGSIVQAAGEVAQEIEGMARLTRSQSNDIAQISVLLGEVNGATQQNSTLVEETAAAGSQLLDQARALSNLISAFSLPQGGTHMPRLSPPASARLVP
ncbi:MAG: methyl-accepting chemotaxis protein [Ramlibacter sp.]|jgi:methyl-accepting chemotaxis protein|nr:methyl-accepting chemotaxis protein [Ramlibacter sp.]